MWQCWDTHTRDLSPVFLAWRLAAVGTTILTHLALVHVSWTLVVVREGDEVGHHTQNAVREELLVSGDSRHNVWLHCGHVHENLQESHWTGWTESRTKLPQLTPHFSFSCDCWLYLSAGKENTRPLLNYFATITDNCKESKSESMKLRYASYFLSLILIVPSYQVPRQATTWLLIGNLQNVT